MSIGNIATSGMQAAMSNMDVISNNIANAGTYAFKSSSASFSDLFPSGNAASQLSIGTGVELSGVTQDFSAGDPIQTGVNSDFCINGNGFFVLKDPTSGQSTYTRYGHMNFNQSTGYFTLNNSRLQGFTAVNGAIPPGSSPTDLFINTGTVPASATQNVTQQGLNLNASDVAPTASFSTTDPTSYNFTTKTSMYDSLGSQHNLNLYYVKTASNTWTVNAYVDGASVGTGSLAFNSSGQLQSSSGLTNLSFSPTTGAQSPQTFNISMANATQYGSSVDAASPFKIDGSAVGTFQTYTVDSSGNVKAIYSNNSQGVLVGQIAIANFPSPAGLQDMGNMSFAPTSTSGNPNVSPSNSNGNITQQQLELSNVNLASEMVNLINAQNTFQANAQVEQIYTQIMQTVTKL